MLHAGTKEAQRRSTFGEMDALNLAASGRVVSR